MNRFFNWFRMYSAGVVTPPDVPDEIDLKEFEVMFAAQEDEEWE